MARKLKRLAWYGPEIGKLMRGASAAGVAEATQKAAETVRRAHAWKNRTGETEASISTWPVEETRHGQRGDFGYGKWQGMFLEIGARGRPGSHDLRTAGDREFTALADHIAKAAGL